MSDQLTLADAILAGASLLKTKPGVQFQSADEGETPSGCALGMANIAAGAKYVSGPVELRAGETMRDQGTSLVWGKWVEIEVERPCECVDRTQQEMAQEAHAARLRGEFSFGAPIISEYLIFKLLPPRMTISAIIPHLFDSHVACESPTWTIEQLSDWVRSVEAPAREAERAERERLDKELMANFSMPWPSNLRSPAEMSLMMLSMQMHLACTINWNSTMRGAMTPGNDIQMGVGGDPTKCPVVPPAKPAPAQPDPKPAKEEAAK